MGQLLLIDTTISDQEWKKIEDGDEVFHSGSGEFYIKYNSRDDDKATIHFNKEDGTSSTWEVNPSITDPKGIVESLHMDAFLKKNKLTSKHLIDVLSPKEFKLTWQMPPEVIDPRPLTYRSDDKEVCYFQRTWYGRWEIQLHTFNYICFLNNLAIEAHDTLQEAIDFIQKKHFHWIHATAFAFTSYGFYIVEDYGRGLSLQQKYSCKDISKEHLGKTFREAIERHHQRWICNTIGRSFLLKNGIIDTWWEE